MDWSQRLRALPPPVVDIGLTVLALVAQTVPFLFSDRDGGGPWTAVEIAPALLAALPVLGRRHAPVACLLLSSTGVVVYSLVGGHGPGQPVWYGALICMYAVADRSARPWRLVALAASAVGIVLVGGLFGSVASAVREGVLWGAAYALGRAAHVGRAYAAAVEERATRLERERVEAAERAVLRERARIARDMHDVLAHSVSLMVVQAEAGPVARADPDRMEAAFDAIAGAGRDALAQLRRILGLLADGDPRSAPTLDDLPALLAGVGPGVRLVTGGDARPVAPEVAAAAYRIVQEALTNVVKHAGRAPAVVELDWAAAELVVTVTDDGPGPGAAPGRGLGLISIGERAAACGGSARCGPAPSGRGFEVSARLPA